MKAGDALKEFDSWLAQANQRAKDAQWFQDKKDAQDAIDAAQERWTSPRENFIKGPFPKQKVDAFLMEYRQFRQDQEACRDCSDLRLLHANDRAFPMCSMHAGWGQGMCWKRGE